MNGCERLQIMYDEWEKKHKTDVAFKQTVQYLLNRTDLDEKYLNEEKNIEVLNEFIHKKAQKHSQNGWCYIPDEVVHSWAVMYFTLPNSFLKIKEKKNIENITKKTNNEKNNVISLETAKEKLEKKKETEQLSIFGGNEE